VIPIPTHAAASDPAKVWAKQLMSDVDRLTKEGKLIEARQKALVAVEAQKSGANFEEEEATPERVLLQLAGQASKQIETLLNESADYMANRRRRSVALPEGRRGPAAGPSAGCRLRPGYAADPGQARRPAADAR